VFAFNFRAIHVYEKLGFVREGLRREVLFMDGVYHDAVVMGLLQYEYASSL
jgi:RimJ/RimL family protein N-acetyltransferase